MASNSVSPAAAFQGRKDELTTAEEDRKQQKPGPGPAQDAKTTRKSGGHTIPVQMF